MPRLRPLIALIALAGFLAACGQLPRADRDRPGPACTGHRDGQELTAELARAALLVMIQQFQPDAPARTTLDATARAVPKPLPAGRVAIGPWQCDLTSRTFTWAIAKPPVFFQQRGEFVKTLSGTWEAIVTETARN